MRSDKKLNIALTVVSVLVVGISGTLLWKYLYKRRQNTQEGGKVNDSNLPKNFAIIPGGRGNYRTDQPTLKEFEYIFRKYPKIKNVIRMNGEEGTGVTVEAERKLVENSGRQFIYESAHKGFVDGKGYTQSIEKMVPYLLKGNTLIHCTHGADRTGYIVAKYLQDIKFKKWSKEDLYQYTIEYNSWNNGKICHPGSNWGYIKYLEGFYPIEEWCKANGSRKKCESCKKFF
jgi:hypothetical protein|tara:strand:- start:324 stop:1013 length:690 start_codon:yes stop_codon:yes gene_type:complete